MTKRFKIEPDFTCPELAGYKLPPIELDGVGQPLTDYIKEKHNQAECIGFIDGYTKAREKYEFSREDMAKVIEYMIKNPISVELKTELELDFNKGVLVLSKYFERILTPRTPIAIEVEMVQGFEDEHGDFSVSMNNLDGVQIGRATRPSLNPDGTVKGVYIYE